MRNKIEKIITEHIIDGRVFSNPNHLRDKIMQLITEAIPEANVNDLVEQMESGEWEKYKDEKAFDLGAFYGKSQCIKDFKKNMGI